MFSANTTIGSERSGLIALIDYEMKSVDLIVLYAKVSLHFTPQTLERKQSSGVAKPSTRFDLLSYFT